MKNPPQLPTHVEIRTPMHTPRARGKQALTGPHARGYLGVGVRSRLSRQEDELVTRVIELLGMNRAEFVRWCAVEAAQAIERLVHKQETNNE